MSQTAENVEEKKQEGGDGQEDEKKDLVEEKLEITEEIMDMILKTDSFKMFSMHLRGMTA